MPNQESVHALSGAYAIDALEDDERDAFEHHLARCEDCRHEVASLQEAAALMTIETQVAPPPGLRDRLLADVAQVRPLPPTTPRPEVATRHRSRATSEEAAEEEAGPEAAAPTNSRNPAADSAAPTCAANWANSDSRLCPQEETSVTSCSYSHLCPA